MRPRRSRELVDFRDVGEAALFEEAVGGVVVFAGLQVDAADAALAEPGDGGLQQGFSGAAAAALLLYQDVVDHAIGGVSVLLNIGHDKTHDFSLVQYYAAIQKARITKSCVQERPCFCSISLSSRFLMTLFLTAACFP